MLFVHPAYRPPMHPGRARRLLTLGDQLWHVLAALAAALLIGGDIVLGAWALVQAHHPLWAITLLGLALLATVLVLALYFANAVAPTRKEPPVHDDDQNAENYRQWRASRGWCGLALGAVATVTALALTLLGTRPRRRARRATVTMTMPLAIPVPDEQR